MKSIYVKEKFDKFKFHRFFVQFKSDLIDDVVDVVTLSEFGQPAIDNGKRSLFIRFLFQIVVGFHHQLKAR